MTIHIAGGAPSTGSSLLRSMVNAHSRFISGPETYLFAHPRLYHHWTRDKHLLIRKGLGGLKNETTFRLNGAVLDKPWYGWSHPELTGLLNQSPSFPSFCMQYFKKALDQERASHVLEKSPVNSYCFREFIEHFPVGRVIHCIRDPYDATASMLGRGHGVVSAVTSHLFQATFGLAARTHERYTEIRYEKLVGQPKETLSDLMGTFGELFEAKMIDIREEHGAEATQLPGWAYDETQAPGTASIGRFDRLPESVRNDLLHAFHKLEFKTNWVEKHALPARNMRELCHALGYTWREMETPERRYLPQKEILKIRWDRAIRLYPNSLWNYPFTLSGE